MSSALCLKNRRTFILLEVLLGMTLVALSLPFLIKDTQTYQKKIKELEFYNEFEIAFRKEMFHLYDTLYLDPFYEQIKKVPSQNLYFDYTTIHIHNKHYPIKLEVHNKEIDPTNKNFQISVILKAEDLPLPFKRYQSNLQKIYLKNEQSAMSN